MKRNWLIAASAALLITATGCGSDAKSTSTTAVPVTAASSTTPSSVATTAGSVVATTADSAPSSSASSATTSPAVPSTPDSASIPVANKIVSLSPTATEMLFAIGAGAQVIAVDDQSNFPAEALKKPHDLSGYQPNVEAIAALKPDLVAISDDSTGLSKQLDALGINVWVGPAASTFDDVYAQIGQLGVSTGHVAQAATVVGAMQKAISTAVSSVPDTSKALTYYHELDPTYYSVTSKTFIGSIYSLFGLVDIADKGPVGNDYPQLSSEFIVEQNPAFIFLADTKCCQQTPAAVAARPGWAPIAAVKDAHVIALDDDIASRWGPRIVDYVQAVAAALSGTSSTATTG